MKRRVLLLLTALIAAAMMSVGPAFADSGDCDWDGNGNWRHDNGDWCDDNNGGGGANIPHIILQATTSWVG